MRTGHMSKITAPAEQVEQVQQQLAQQSVAGGGQAEGSGETGRICFPFLNSGTCARGNLCKFRHLEQDHPDAIADRLRTGHTHKLPPSMQPQQPPPPAAASAPSSPQGGYVSPGSGGNSQVVMPPAGGPHKW